MAVSVLSQASRFNQGADLWIVPAIRESHHTLQIDWYLNFQISQAENKLPLKLSQELRTILQQTDLTSPEIPVPSNRTLMVLAVNSLPCRWVVALSNSNNLKVWTKDLFAVWQNLGHPSLRIFLPSQVSINHLLSSWHEFSSFEEFTVVLDS